MMIRTERRIAVTASVMIIVAAIILAAMGWDL